MMKKLRFWLVRRLLGTDKISDATNSVRTTLYANAIEYAAEKIVKDTKRYTSEYTSQLIGKFSPDILATAIESNDALTEQQKTQIAYILRTQKEPEGSYLQ